MLKLLLWILKRKKLKSQDRALVLNVLLESVNALPIADIITFDLDRTVKIAGKSLTIEQAVSFRESVTALENNWAYRTIKEQIAYEAIKMGIHSSTDIGGVLFSKAAIWIQQQEIRLIKSLIGQEDN